MNILFIKKIMPYIEFSGYLESTIYTVWRNLFLD